MYSQQDGDFVPFAPAGRVFALGLTYACHVRESGERRGVPEAFVKDCRPDAESRAIAVPSARTLMAEVERLDPALAAALARRLGELPALLDYEVEIGIALLDDWPGDGGGGARRCPRIGFFLANDVTVRSVQIAGEGSLRRLDFWRAAKSLPGFLPVSPLLWVPRTPSFERWPEVTLSTRVNGEVRQRASSGDILHGPGRILELAAAIADDRRLRRGDIVLTGTPAGVALSVPRWKRVVGRLLPRRVAIAAAIAGNRDNPRFLKPGDALRLDADWLGSRVLTIER